MNKKVIVLGMGGHAKVLLDAMSHNEIDVIGYTDFNQCDVAHASNYPYLGRDEAVLKLSREDVWLVNGIGMLPSSNQPRHDCFKFFKGKGYRFLSVIHPSAIIAHDVLIDEGAQIMAGVILQTGVSIGANTIVNTSASIDHDCKIGRDVHIAPGVVMSGGVKVGDRCFIGIGARIIQNTQIVKNAFVRAGEVVMSDILELIV